MTTERKIALRSIGAGQTRCRSCGQWIHWAVTQAGKRIPVNAGVQFVRPENGSLAVSSSAVHFATCPQAAAHRRQRRSEPSERID
jgi:hypothetical protein